MPVFLIVGCGNSIPSGMSGESAVNENLSDGEGKLDGTSLTPADGGLGDASLSPGRDSLDDASLLPDEDGLGDTSLTPEGGGLGDASSLGGASPTKGDGAVIVRDFMHNASPDTSALTLSVYDGSVIKQRYIFDAVTEQEILNRLNAVPATAVETWSLDDIKPPVYGLEIGSVTGHTIRAAWSDGYFISPNGPVYRFDFDFAKLEKDYAWSGQDTLPSFSLFPCARRLTLNETGWNSALLTPAAEASPPHGITMALEEWADDAVTVNFTNRQGNQWLYGEAYSLQVSLDGIWYDVPPAPGDWGFDAIGYHLADGETRSQTYSLGMYGDLPEGIYRLTAKGLSVTHGGNE